MFIISHQYHVWQIKPCFETERIYQLKCIFVAYDICSEKKSKDKHIMKWLIFKFSNWTTDANHRTMNMDHLLLKQIIQRGFVFPGTVIRKTKHPPCQQLYNWKHRQVFNRSLFLLIILYWVNVFLFYINLLSNFLLEKSFFKNFFSSPSRQDKLFHKRMWTDPSLFLKWWFITFLYLHLSSLSRRNTVWKLASRWKF